MIMEIKIKRKNTFTAENMLATSISLITVMVVMGFAIPDVNRDISKGISVKNVNSIVVDSENTKWFSTDAGIVSYDGKNWKSYDENENIPNQQLRGFTFIADQDGTELWIATSGGITVARLPIDDQTEVTTYDLENENILSKEIIGVMSGEDALLWIATDKGVLAVSRDKWLTPDYEMHYPEMLFSMFPITSMATDQSGDSLYVGTSGAGVARVYRDDLDGISGASIIAQWGPIALPSDYVHSIFIAPDGARWFGTEEGAARHTGKDLLDMWDVYTIDEGLVDNFVQAISGDKEGRIWFGTQSGISVFDGSSWISYTTENGLVSNNVLSLATDQDGVVWIGTDSGINSYENKKFIKY